MTHKSNHVIVTRVREFIAAWPLSTTGAVGVLGFLTRFIG